MSQIALSNLRSPRWTCSSCSFRLRLLSLRWNSTSTTPVPGLLSRMRNDLKTAMRAKDTARLNVLRGIISDINNASKTPNPVTNDLQILAMLKKRKSSSQAASKEAAEANREDLQEKYSGEIGILDEYAGTVKMMSEEEVTKIVDKAIGSSQASGTKPGLLLKELFAKGGPLDGQPVDRAQVAKIVKEKVENTAS